MADNFLSSSVEIVNKKGLHARAASCFVKCAEQFDVQIWVEKDGNRVSGNSIMGLMMLAAAKGSHITLLISGKEADLAMAALTKLIADRFGEEE